MDISIPSSLKENIDKHAVISFDGFDTLLIRKVAEPHDVFRLVEQNLNQVGFARERIEAEELARKLAQGREVTFGKLFKNPCSQAELNKIVPFGFSLQRQKMVFFCHQNSIILLC